MRKREKAGILALRVPSGTAWRVLGMEAAARMFLRGPNSTAPPELSDLSLGPTLVALAEQFCMRPKDDEREPLDAPRTPAMVGIRQEFGQEGRLAMRDAADLLLRRLRREYYPGVEGWPDFPTMDVARRQVRGAYLLLVRDLQMHHRDELELASDARRENGRGDPRMEERALVPMRSSVIEEMMRHGMIEHRVLRREAA